MIVYLIMFGISELFCFLYAKQKESIHSGYIRFQIRKKNIVNIRRLTVKDFWLILSALPFFIVAAIRYNVGTDYHTYIRLQIPEIMRGVTWRVEFLYRQLVKFGMSLGDVQWVFVITHLLIIFFVWKAIKEQSVHLGWSVFVFMFGTFYNNSLNLMRQFVGMAICLYGIKYILNKDFKRYLITVGIASLFHRTALLLLPLYFITEIKINWIWSLLGTAFCLFISPFLRRIMVYSSNIIGLYYNYFNDIRYDINNTQYDFIIFEVIILVICLYCSFYPNIRNTNSFVDGEDRKRNIYIWFQTIATVIACLSRIIPNSTRIILLTSMMQIIYVPYFIYSFKNKKTRRFIGFSFLCIFILLFIRVIIIRGVGHTLPYQTIFSR